MGPYRVETRELEDLRRKHSVACGLIAEQGAVIKAQADTLHLQSAEINYLRKMLAKTISKVGAGETAPEGHNAKAVGLADALSGQSRTSDGLCPGANNGESK